MSKRVPGVNLFARAGLVAIALGIGGMSAVGPASASTDNFGQAVSRCANLMLPYAIGSNGAITMTMPDGWTMHWRSFGEMVTFMRTQQMCS